ncbi:MAG: hypothetical protein WC690_06670 [bacterium]
MADEILKPAPSTASEPFSQKIGVLPAYSLRIPISTSISEKGLGHSAGLDVHYAENFNDSYTLALRYNYYNTTMKLQPSTTSEGTTAEHTHKSVQAGFGRWTLLYPYFGENGDFMASLRTGITPLLGRGGSTFSNPDRTLRNGDTLSYPGGSASTWDIGTEYTIKGEWRPDGGRGPVIGIGPGFYYGIQNNFDKNNPDFKRVILSGMLMLEVGYGDGSTIPGGDADTEVGGVGIGQNAWQLVHGYFLRYGFSDALLETKEKVDAYGLTSSSGPAGPGSQYDVAMLQAGSTAFYAIGSKPSIDLRAGQGWFWGFAAIRAIGGAAFLTSGSVEGRSGGAADIFGVLRLVQYPMWGIEEPDKRLSLSQEEVAEREAYINLVSYGLNLAATLIGGVVGSETVQKGASTANVAMGFAPNPTERPMKRYDLRLEPYTIYCSNNLCGHRAGFNVHNDFNSIPFYASASFHSPMLIAGNVGNVSSQSQPFSNATVPTGISASMGPTWTTTYTRLYGGPRTTVIFGSDDKKVGVGATAGFDILLPFNGESNGSGISLGAGVNGLKTSPNGYEYEFRFGAGVTMGN